MSLLRILLGNASLNLSEIFPGIYFRVYRFSQVFPASFLRECAGEHSRRIKEPVRQIRAHFERCRRSRIPHIQENFEGICAGGIFGIPHVFGVRHNEEFGIVCSHFLPLGIFVFLRKRRPLLQIIKAADRFPAYFGFSTNRHTLYDVLIGKVIPRSGDISESLKVWRTQINRETTEENPERFNEGFLAT